MKDVKMSKKLNLIFESEKEEIYRISGFKEGELSNFGKQSFVLKRLTRNKIEYFLLWYRFLKKKQTFTTEETGENSIEALFKFFEFNSIEEALIYQQLVLESDTESLEKYKILNFKLIN